MNRQDYLLDIERLLGSRRKIRLLKSLYKFRNLEKGMSSIARDAGISVNQARLIIDEYRSMGFVDTRVEGKSVLVRLIPGTIYSDFITVIMRHHSCAHEKLMNSIKKRTDRAWIFGSYARNDLRENSDIDILTTNQNVAEIASYFLKDISILDPKDLKKDLLSKIKKEGLEIGKG